MKASDVPRGISDIIHIYLNIDHTGLDWTEGHAIDNISVFFFLIQTKDEVNCVAYKSRPVRNYKRLIELFPSTEIFSKRRKIYAFWRETRVILAVSGKRAGVITEYLAVNRLIAIVTHVSKLLKYTNNHKYTHKHAQTYLFKPWYEICIYIHIYIWVCLFVCNYIIVWVYECVFICVCIMYVLKFLVRYTKERLYKIMKMYK